MLILASTSPTRQKMLHASGVEHEAVAAHVDETAAKEAFAAQALNARALADALAELKAVKVSQRLPGALVLGADQVLTTEDGPLFAQPKSRQDAASQLLGIVKGACRGRGVEEWDI